MTPEMAFECLLVSRDPALYSTIDRVLRNFSIVVDHCLSSQKACNVITKGTHDLVVIDWEGEASSELLDAIWSLAKKKKPTIVAISDEGIVRGAHVNLPKPLTLEAGTKSLKAAYSRMVLDHRLNARYPLMVRAAARDLNGRSLSITVTDVGDGGMGLRTNERLDLGDILSVSFELPELPTALHIQARVIWTREYGTAGAEILVMAPVERDMLRDWLKTKARIKKPLIPVSM